MLLSALVILLLRVILPPPLPVVGAVNHTNIFVDPISGTASEKCWTDGKKLPCRMLDLALQGAENAFSNVSVLLKPGVYNLTNAYNFIEKKGFNLVVWEDNNLVSATIHLSAIIHAVMSGKPVEPQLDSYYSYSTVDGYVAIWSAYTQGSSVRLYWWKITAWALMILSGKFTVSLLIRSQLKWAQSIT